jgi:hypothetical protein
MSMKIVNTMTIAAVASGPSICITDSSGLAGGTTCTANGCDGEEPGFVAVFPIAFVEGDPGTAAATSFSKSSTVAAALLKL